MSSPLLPTVSLWDFSLHHYAQPGVSELCLQLQDDFNVNVNLVFWVLWLGYRGKKLDRDLLVAAERGIHQWYEQYVKPLRQLRRQMKVDYGTAKKSIESVRERIKQAELLAEKHMQSRLEIMVETPMVVTDQVLMECNLRLYLESQGVGNTDIQTLWTLINL